MPTKRDITIAIIGLIILLAVGGRILFPKEKESSAIRLPFWQKQ